jgi:glycosyltransferase involved in cell wall biosynthesis
VKILWSSPLPPTRSGVSDYAVDLLSELRHRAVVRVVAPPDWRPVAEWPFGDDPRVVSAESRPGDDEINLVHVGNNPHHEWLLDRLVMPRTVVVLHDLVLHHLLVEATLARGHADSFELLLGRSHGVRSHALSRAREFGVTGRRDPFLFPARRSLLDGVQGIVVHSGWALSQLAADLPEIPAARIGLAVADPGAVDRDRLRTELGVPPEAVLLMQIGFLTPEKGLFDVLGGLAAARSQGIEVRLMLVGEGVEREMLNEVVCSVGLSGAVSFTGWTPQDDFMRLPAAADLGVVLRTPSAGETSAAAVRFLACGTPVAVTGLHQFLEWPEAAAPRITPGPSSAADLARLLGQVATGGESWSRRRTQARATYDARHRPDRVAGELIAALEQFID